MKGGRVVFPRYFVKKKKIGALHFQNHKQRYLNLNSGPINLVRKGVVTLMVDRIYEFWSKEYIDCEFLFFRNILF